MIFGKKQSIQKLEDEWNKQSAKMDRYITQRKLISKYLGNSNDEVMIMDAEGHILNVSSEVRKNTGYSSKDFKRFKGLYEFTQLTIDQVKSLIEEAKEKKKAFFETNMTLKKGDIVTKRCELKYDSDFFVCITY